MRQRGCAAALDAKYTKELADAKAENDALRMMLPLVAVGCIHQSSLSVSAWSYHASGVDNAASRLADTAERIISPSERGQSLCKNNWRNPGSILMSSADRVAHIAKSCNYCEQYTRASSEHKCLVINRAIHLWMFAGFLFTGFLRAMAASTVFLPTRNEEMMGDGFLWCYCCCRVLNSKRLLSTSCSYRPAQ